METASLEGGFAQAPTDAARAFRSALDALSRPGVVHEVAGAAPPLPLSPAAGALVLTLCDPETPVWLAPSVATDLVVDWFRFHTGAPMAPRAEAAFAFGPWDALAPIHDFAIGTAEYPDRSATLVVEMPALGAEHRLTGPGIQDAAHLTLPDPQAFRANAALFPLGVDFFLTSGARLAGVPRTTRVEG